MKAAHINPQEVIFIPSNLAPHELAIIYDMIIRKHQNANFGNDILDLFDVGLTEGEEW